MSQRIADELRGIELHDQRLNQRSQRVLETLAANPEASINAACHGWSETQAAYRFFDNPAVTPEALLSPHATATVARLQQQPVVLIVQDTTELDFTKHPPKDAHCLNEATRFGLYAHTHLAVTPEHLNLGVLRLDYHARAPETLGKAAERSHWPIEQKESYRWLQGYRLACEVARRVPTARIVSVADREADMYDIYLAAQEQEQVADYLVRARVERCTTERNPAGGPETYGKVRDEVAATPVRVRQTLELAATPKRAARHARLVTRACTVVVRPPLDRPTLPPVTLNVVWVTEVGGPDDDTTVSWLLLTSLPIQTVADLKRIIAYYAARWTIETYFRTWKTGCRIEAIQLETVARLQRCLALYAIIAWRIMYLTQWGRTQPNVPCTVAFTPVEWYTVWRVVKRQPVPKKPPTLGVLVSFLAQLGGYNNRTKEAPPGPQTIWVGLRRLADFLLALHHIDQRT